jgi:small subunit ribosomal protein S18
VPHTVRDYLFSLSLYSTKNLQFIRPHDLSLAGRSFKNRPVSRPAAIPPSTRDARDNDVFYQLGIDPLKYAMHPAVVSQFMSEMAKIYPRRTTGLTSKSQRRIAKAIRRAKMMGVIPLHSRLRNYGNMF